VSHQSSKTNESLLNINIVIPLLMMIILLGWIIVLLGFIVAASLLRRGQGTRDGAGLIPEPEVLINFYEF
jgi:hypothetical protein